jgi:hypothetical protein
VSPVELTLGRGGGGGGGSKSYEGDKALSSINNSILSVFKSLWVHLSCIRPLLLAYLHNFSSPKLPVLVIYSQLLLLYYGDYNKNVQYRRLRSSCILDLHQLVCSRKHHSVVPLSTLCSGFLSPESENPIQSTEKYLTDMPSLPYLKKGFYSKVLLKNNFSNMYGIVILHIAFLIFLIHVRKQIKKD